jgi:alkanesulfonate monooxygenase
MTIELIGITATQETSNARSEHNRVDGISAQTEAGVPVGPTVNPAYAARLAQAHEDAGFDRVLIAHSSATPDGFLVASHVLQSTTRLGVLLAHRPGFLAPTLAARAYATLDAFHPGRVAMHVITGGDDVDQARDGDFSDKVERYRRTGEFIDVLRKTLTSTEPFDHTGEFYRAVDAHSQVKPATDAGIPIYFGGQSDAAVAVGAQHTDVFMLFGEPLAATKERIALIRSEAAKHGRSVEFSISTRPIVADTEEEAWARAAAIYADAERVLREGRPDGLFATRPQDADAPVSASRLQEHAKLGDVHDERLWLGITRLAGPGGNSTAPVGTPAQVAEALLKYYDLGVTQFLIRGFDPLNDVEVWGEELLPLLRKGAAERDAEGAERRDVA